MRKPLMAVNLAMALILLFTVSAVLAQPQEPYAIGEVTIEAKQVVAGIGWTWGDGMLTFKGKMYPLRHQGPECGRGGHRLNQRQGRCL